MYINVFIIVRVPNRTPEVLSHYRDYDTVWTTDKSWLNTRQKQEDTQFLLSLKCYLLCNYSRMHSLTLWCRNFL